MTTAKQRLAHDLCSDDEMGVCTCPHVVLATDHLSTTARDAAEIADLKMQLSILRECYHSASKRLDVLVPAAECAADILDNVLLDVDAAALRAALPKERGRG